ncbi:predicted protein [Postia placenta Mad-698-R]|nr:predicted protein [Postia placenta Mad-698-R]
MGPSRRNRHNEGKHPSSSPMPVASTSRALKRSAKGALKLGVDSKLHPGVMKTEDLECRLAKAKLVRAHLQAEVVEKQAGVKTVERDINELLTLSANLAQSLFQQLVEDYSCPFAYPLTTDCGHTYCALCVLKPIFTHCDPQSGQWDHNINCPKCSRPLLYNKQDPPGYLPSLPLTSNKTAAAAINEIFSVITRLCDMDNDNNNANGICKPAWHGWLPGGAT